jgi:hypothetical protein
MQARAPANREMLRGAHKVNVFWLWGVSPVARAAGARASALAYENLYHANTAAWRATMLSIFTRWASRLRINANWFCARSRL